MNRRSLFKRTAALVVSTALAPLIPIAEAPRTPKIVSGVATEILMKAHGAGLMSYDSILKEVYKDAIIAKLNESSILLSKLGKYDGTAFSVPVKFRRLKGPLDADEG